MLLCSKDGMDWGTCLGTAQPHSMGTKNCMLDPSSEDVAPLKEQHTHANTHNHDAHSVQCPAESYKESSLVEGLEHAQDHRFGPQCPQSNHVRGLIAKLTADLQERQEMKRPCFTLTPNSPLRGFPFTKVTKVNSPIPLRSTLSSTNHRLDLHSHEPPVHISYPSLHLPLFSFPWTMVLSHFLWLTSQWNCLSNLDMSSVCFSGVRGRMRYEYF